MERFKIEKLARIIEDLHDSKSSFSLGQMMNPAEKIDKEERDDFTEVLTRAEAVLKELNLLYAANKISHSLQFLKEHESMDIFAASADTEARNIQEAVEDSLRKFEFIKIADGREIYINKFLMGELVQQRFPSAKKDIWEAKSCLMAGCDTAAVFHLMRVVEFGLRALCNSLGFRNMKNRIKDKFTIKGAQKFEYQPIEYAMWEKILNQLPGKINKRLIKMKPSPRKQDQQEFYANLITEIDAFRMGWRNHVMHSRVWYTAADADAIKDHVERFMKKLAGKVSEA